MTCQCQTSISNISLQFSLTCSESAGSAVGLVCNMKQGHNRHVHSSALGVLSLTYEKSCPGTLEKDSQAARTLAFNKIGIAKAITGFGIGVIMSDADVVWQRDPTDYCTS